MLFLLIDCQINIRYIYKKMIRYALCYSLAQFESIVHAYPEIARGKFSPYGTGKACVISIGDSMSSHPLKGSQYILNVDFDDCSYSESGLSPISDETARRIVDFIDEMNDTREILFVHCTAGISRSQAVIRYVLDIFGESSIVTRASNPCLTPNMDVLSALKHQKYLKLYNISE